MGMVTYGIRMESNIPGSLCRGRGTERGSKLGKMEWSCLMGRGKKTNFRMVKVRLPHGMRTDKAHMRGS